MNHKSYQSKTFTETWVGNEISIAISLQKGKSIMFRKRSFSKKILQLSEQIIRDLRSNKRKNNTNEKSRK